MNNFARIFFCGLLLIACGAVNQAAAEENVLPIAQTEYQGIPYLSGGASLDAREQLDAEGRNYSLKLVFAGKNGEYLSDIKVGILDRAGKKVLDAVSTGPWFFCKLPPGKYTVTATMMSKEKRSRVNIGKGQSTLRFYWAESEY
ncbi:MAG: carboxypeptidase regulatory-like domain-containing protein [Smithellaceae bacterium]